MLEIKRFEGSIHKRKLIQDEGRFPQWDAYASPIERLPGLQPYILMVPASAVKPNRRLNVSSLNGSDKIYLRRDC